MTRPRDDIRVGGHVYEPGWGWREIVEMESAADYVTRIAQAAPSRFGINGSAAGRCALYGGPAKTREQT